MRPASIKCFKFHVELESSGYGNFAGYRIAQFI